MFGSENYSGMNPLVVGSSPTGTTNVTEALMKIIDNKKDYYDYLMGVYGIDEKIVYDRRGSITKDYYFKSPVMQDERKAMEDTAYRMALRIGNVIYTFIRDHTTGYKWVMPEETTHGSWRNVEHYKNPRVISDEELEKYENGDCPLVLVICYSGRRSTYYSRYNDEIVIKNPIIQSFGIIPGFIPVETIWEHLYNFIAHKYDKKIVDNRTDVEHLEAHGFDKKTSFRNVK